MAVYETSSPHSRPPLSSPVGSRVQSEDATPSPASPAQLWSQVSVTPHTQTPLRDALPFESGPCAPFRCPTVGTSVTPLVPLVRSLGAWLELPSPSRWLLRTIRLGYAIQFTRRSQFTVHSMACSAPLQNAVTREAYTGPLGQHCDRCVHQPPGRSTLPSHVATRPPSPPLESEASEVASRGSCPRRAQSCSRRALTSARPSRRMATPPRGTPADLETLRGCSGRPVCLPGHVSLPVVFLPVRGDPRYGCAGMQLASGLTQICVSPSEPSRTDPVQGQGGRGASPLGGALLAQSDLVPRTNAPRDSPSLANSSEEGSTFSERGHPLAPAPRLVEPPRMVLGRDTEVLSGLPPAVVNTITSARALSTRQAYRLKWNLFVNWCSPRR